MIYEAICRMFPLFFDTEAVSVWKRPILERGKPTVPFAVGVPRTCRSSSGPSLYDTSGTSRGTHLILKSQDNVLLRVR